MDPQELLDGKYRVVDVLGRGATVTTYLAEDTTDGARVVVKRFSLRKALTMRPSHSASSVEGDATWHSASEAKLGFKLVELFEREGRILSELRHPNVPRLLDFVTRESEDDTELLLVQQFVPGENLARLVADGRHFTEAEVVEIGLRVARVLKSLHLRQPPLIHRDIKPSNVLLHDDGEVFLVDFGAVKQRVEVERTLVRLAATARGTCSSPIGSWRTHTIRQDASGSWLTTGASEYTT